MTPCLMRVESTNISYKVEHSYYHRSTTLLLLYVYNKRRLISVSKFHSAKPFWQVSNIYSTILISVINVWWKYIIDGELKLYLYRRMHRTFFPIGCNHQFVHLALILLLIIRKGITCRYIGPTLESSPSLQDSRYPKVNVWICDSKLVAIFIFHHF